MENDTTVAKQGLLEPVSIGSVTFENSILAPLRNNYLYEESKECFSYNSAFLINNAALQRRYSAYRDEKRMNGYSEEELEESFGFLLFDDKSRANRLADTGLVIGQGTCTILGDCSKGVYISKYSDCLDLKRWYDGKKGYIVLLKLTKGRVKEVTENYTQNFTPPTIWFDCHVSEQLSEVCATTSSFLAFERTQYYMFEHLDGGSKVEQCPRHVYPFAVVAFSYGKTTVSLKKKSQEKTSFHYQPWRGHLKIGSLLYTIGLKSTHGAMFPANLPKTVQVSHAIGVSELRKTLPQAIFETSLLGEVSLDGRWFSLYDVVSFEEKNDLDLLIQDLKEKDMALVVHLKDSGFLVLLHSSNFLSYEGAGTDKALSFQGMFIFPDSRTVPRETKREHNKDMVPAEILQILPALNYAELEMEKCPLKQQEGPLGVVEKHLQNFAALIFPELSNSPGREASMFPDQYDVPDGFPLIAPKWTSEAGAHLKTYLGNPQSFQIPVSRALELLASGKQQRTDDHDDDVYYYISSPEEAPRTPAEMVFERDLTSEPDQITISNNDSDELKNSAKQQAEKQKTETIEQPHCTLSENIRTPGTAVVATAGKPIERTAPSPKSGDLPMEHYVNTAEDSRRTSEGNECSAVSGLLSNETPIQTTNVLLSTKTEYSASYVPSNTRPHHETESNLSKKVDCMPVALSKVTCEILDMDKDVPQGTSPLTSISSSTSSADQFESNKDVQLQTNSNDLAQTNPKCVTGRQGKRRKKKAPKRNVNTVQQIPTSPQDTTPSSCKSLDSPPEQSINNETTPNSLKRNWRSLPRQKKLWKTDENLRRTLRSDIKPTHMQSDVNTSDTEKNTTLTELTAAENIVASTPKRKMEKFSMRERYGLKTIITDCGRVFVPHGSEIATEDAKTNEGQDPCFVTNSPTLLDMACPLPLQTIPVSPGGTGHSFERMTEQSDENTEQLLDSGVKPTLPEKLKSKKDHVYKAISISKLKTVLKRARRAHSPGTENQGKSKSDHAEPEPKTPKTYVLPELTESQASSSSSSSQGKLISKIPKENGCSIFYSPSPFELVKQVDQQLISTFIGDRVGGKYISSDGKSSADGLTIGVSVPSDALNLLADLALSVNSDKTLPNLGMKPRQETHLGASPKSVLHNLLRGPDRLKLPAKSPYPEGLVVTGDLILEISKEHSYSQPNSLLSGLTGTCTQVQPPVGSVESHLALHSLTLPDHASSPVCQDNKGKNGWSILVDKPSPPNDKAEKVQRFEFLHQRRVIEKDDSIQVTRYWKENYDFRFDSKFTNEKLDKCLTRALHGQWDFNFEDTYEQVHLIFHMWIGLFYSKPTSRFFHFDNNCPPLKKKDLANVLQTPVPTSLPVLNIDLCSKEGNSSTLQPLSGALDLSAKLPASVEHSVSQSSRGETPGLISGMRSRLMHSKDYKEPAVEANLSLSSSVQPHVTFMEYRTKVDVLDKNSVPDIESSDLEKDTTNTDDNSYTELLVNNSAYNQLCEQASNMSIDELKLLNTQTNVLDCKDQGTSQALMVERHGKTTTDTTVAVTRRATRSFRPAILSKARVSQRKKVIIKTLRFKYKSKNEAHKVVSKDEEGLKENNESSSFLVCCHDDKDESPFKTQATGSNSDNARPLCLESGENYNMGIEACSRVSTPTDSGGVKEKPVCIDRNKPISNDFEDTSIFGLDENNKMDEVEPMNDDSSRHDVRNGASIKTEVNKTTDKVTPKNDVENQTPADTNEVEVRDDTPVNLQDVANDEQDKAHFKHDASIDSAVDVQNLNDNTTSKDNRELYVENMSVQDLKTTNIEANPKLDVGDYTKEAVQDVNCGESNKVKHKLDVTERSSTVEQRVVDDSPKSETGSGLDITDCSTMVEEQDVDDSTKSETGPGLDITDCSTMVEEQDVDDSTKSETGPGLDITDCSTMVEEQDVEDSVKSETGPGLDITDSTMVEEQDVEDSAKSETGPGLDITDSTMVEEQNVDDGTKNEIVPGPDVTNCCPTIEEQDVDDDTKNKTRPGLDVTDYSAIVEQQDVDDRTKSETGPALDFTDSSSLNEQQDVDDSAKSQPGLVLDVTDCSSLNEQQDVDDSAKSQPGLVLDVTDCSSLNEQQDVDDSAKSETGPALDFTDCSSLNEQQDVDDSAKSQPGLVLDVTDCSSLNEQQDVDDSAKSQPGLVLDVTDCSSLNEQQDVDDSAKSQPGLVLDVTDCSSLNEQQDVDDSAKSQPGLVLDVTDCSSLNEQQDVDDSAKSQPGLVLDVTDCSSLNEQQDVDDSVKSETDPGLDIINCSSVVEEQDVDHKKEIKPGPGLDVIDCSSVDEQQDVMNITKNKTETPVNVKDHSFMDELQNVNLSTDYKTECKLITDHIPVIVQDLNETEPKHDADCAAENVLRVIDGTNSETDYKLDVIHETQADVQDVNDGIHNETEPKLDVGKYVSMNEQDVTFSLNDETDSNSNVEDDILMDVHDVNSSTNNEMKPVLDIRDCSSQSELQDNDTAGNMTASGIIANVTEECKLKRDESDTEDLTAERESREEAELPCNNTVTTSEEQKMTNESSQVFSWEQDWTDCVDMDISEDEVNVSHDETITQMIKRDTISQEGGIRTQTSMEVTEEEHTRECSRQELAMDISVAQVSSADQQLSLLEEGDHSPTIGGMSSTIQKEITMLDNALMDQHEIPEVNQDKATIMPLCTEVIISEPHGMTDSNHWASASATDDSSILNVSSKPTERDDSSEKQTQRDGSDQPDSVPAVCKVTETIKDCGIQEVSPPGLQMYTEPNIDSRNLTPAKDELPFDQDFHEGSCYQEVNVQYSHSSKMMHHELNRSNTLLASDSPEARAFTSLGHRAQTFSHVPFWPSRQYDSTVKPSDEHFSKQNFLHFDYGDMFLPRDLVYKETESQMDQFCSFSESHNYDSYSEVSLSWTNEFNFRTDGLQRLEKSYTHDDEDLHFSVSVHKSETNRPKEIRDTTSEVRSLAHYSDSSESKERVHSFRHRSDLSDLNDEAGSRGSESFCYISKKRKKHFCRNKWDESDDTTNYSVRKTFLCGAHRTRIGESSPYERKDGRQPFDWRRYFRREGVFDSNEGDDKPFHNPPSSIVTMFDKKGNRVVFEKYLKQKRPTDTHSSVGKPFCNVVDQQAKLDLTQSLMELEYLIFSEKMTHLLKQGKAFPKAQSQSKPKATPVENPMTIKFSRLDEQDSFASFNETWPTLSKFKISVDMSDKKGSKKTTNYGKPLHLHSLFCEKNNKAACSKILDITKESAKSYHTMMNDICTGKSIPHQFDDAKRNWDTEGAACSKQSGFCSRIKKDMFDNLHDNLNTVVRQACKIKYRFYILVTSADLFFEETKNLLEAEGHTAVAPYEFDLEVNEQAPLLIILRNEDIAEHICEVPHLLELKKSPRVLFAGVDQPDDVINLTHQELFAKGGFVVFDENALVTLNLDNMKKMVAIMEELDKKAKWKWFLHYRDSRKFRENARCNPEAQRKKQFMDCCQEAGIVEVLPYHECDIISQARPGYLQCLVRLQIHNVSARFPVFITDTPDDTFEKNGILTMNIYTFLRIISHETCSVS